MLIAAVFCRVDNKDIATSYFFSSVRLEVEQHQLVNLDYAEAGHTTDAGAFEQRCCASKFESLNFSLFSISQDQCGKCLKQLSCACIEFYAH